MGRSDITFTIQAEDDDGNLSDSSSVRSGAQPARVRIPVVGLEKAIFGRASSVNSDGALTPVAATLNRWRGASVGGALTIFVELHRAKNSDELLVGSGHGVTSIVSSWRWDAQSEIGILSLEGSRSARASDFRSVLSFLQLRSAVDSSDSYRRILVRPDISGSAFRKDFHVREVKVYVNDAPSAPAAGLDDHAVKEDVASDHATATYQVPKFTDDEDTELRYEAKLVVVGRKNVESLFGLPQWMNFDGSPGSRTFTFTPDKSWHAGEYRLRVTATDSGGLSDSEDFVVAVAEVNDAPKVPAVGLSEHTVTEDESAVTYQVPKFTDDEDTELRYEAKLVQGGKAGALPKWVAFDAGSRTFTFTPDKSWHAGKYTLRVRGTDSGGLSDSVDFVVTVKDVNDAPIASRLRGCGGCVCDLSVLRLRTRKRLRRVLYTAPICLFFPLRLPGRFCSRALLRRRSVLPVRRVRFGRDGTPPRARRSLFRTGYRSMEVSVCFVFRPRRVRMWADMRCVFVGGTRAGRRRRRILRCAYLPRRMFR